MDDTINKKAAGGSRAASKQNTQTYGNTAAAQRQRLLDALSRQSVSTIDARRDLDILHPAGRVRELRKQGFNIETVWVWEQTDCGQTHRVGRYLLVGGANHE